MEWIDRFNDAICAIEEQLTQEMDYDRLAQIACCSTYHFQRMFSCLTGIPLSEYIRRRRMSLAAAELRGGESLVLDVALKYGYSSPTAFNRAFQAVHGVAPSSAREPEVLLKTYPPLRLTLSVKGAEEMNYRIEKKEEIRIVGVSIPLHKEIEKNFEIVPQMWQKAAMDGTIPALAAKMDSSPMGLLGVTATSDGENWRYYIAVSSTKPIDGAFEELVIPGFTWAVFPGEGVNTSVQELERRIISEWLPTSGYEYDDGPDIEVYLNADPANAKYEVWIPVVKK